MVTDIVDLLADITPGSPVDGLRRHREQARTNTQSSYDALFVAADATGVTPVERLAVATFVSSLHDSPAAADHYRGLLAAVAGDVVAEQVVASAQAAATHGPYGRFPETADLRDEDEPGPVFSLDDATTTVLGDRLAAALEHAHLLAFRPREASPQALSALVRVGWTTPQIVTLSQLVAFLTFQLRVAHGLRVLQENPS